MSGKQESAENKRGRRNEVTGVVISDKMQKTITVSVPRLVMHARYGKYIKKETVLKAHDETNQAKTGDKVIIFETRPLSKTKRWKLLEVVSKASAVKGVQ